MDSLGLIVPALALVGGLLGGYLAQVVGGSVAERREDRRLLREARVALERWVATRTGPMGWRTQESRQQTWRPFRKGRLKTSSAAIFK